MKWTSLLLLALCGCAAQRAVNPPPLPPAQMLRPGKAMKATRTVRTALAAATQPTMTITNWRNNTQVWLSRGTNAHPRLSAFNLARSLAPSSGPSGTINFVPIALTAPSVWLESHWRGTPYGNLSIQAAHDPKRGPWTVWGNMTADQWVECADCVLTIGWQISDDDGGLFAGQEFMRLVITPP